MEAVTKHEFYDPADFDIYAAQYNTETEDGENSEDSETGSSEGSDPGDVYEDETEEAEGTEKEEEVEPMSGFDLVNKLLKRP